VLALGALWLGSTVGGFGFLLQYSNAAGAVGQVPAAFPADLGGTPAENGLAPDAERATLYLFAHPRCPCTRATLAELERLLGDVGGALRGHVLFTVPSGVEPAWERTDLWRTAQALPDFDVRVDPDGALATRFGARTSGHVLVYSPGGELVFSGGLTAARAHEGANRGRDAVRELVLRGRASEVSTAVFGCELLETCCTADPGHADEGAAR
jgi:hypothetical protein